MAHTELAWMPFFDGLDAAALEQISTQMRPRHFKAGEFICRAGEPGNSLVVIESGLAQVLVERPEGTAPVARLRRGDVVGEMSLLTGEPRSATVLAKVPTDVLELSQDAFATLVGHYPVILVNLGRILSRRLARGNVQITERRHRGEAVALVIGPQQSALAVAAIEATRAASPGAVAVLDLSASLPTAKLPLTEPSVAEALTVLDDLLATHATVLLVAAPGQENLPVLLEHVDRTTVIGREADVLPLATPAAGTRSVEVVLVSEDPHSAPPRVGSLRVIRSLGPDRPAWEIAWLGRHLSRTKLGLALGAGGAKAYAHVGALQVLEEAGYMVDYVAGSSMGAVVGAWIALGMDAAETEATMRRVFTPETAAALFRPTMSGMSTGWDTMARLWRGTTDERSFADLMLPFTAMSVDLDARVPVAITQGLLWEALLASTAIPGLFPPFERGTRRLVDGVVLVPVPTGAVEEAGADLTVAVNLMNRGTLPAWPGQPIPEPPPGRSPRTVDALLEVLDLAQLDASVRHAALADVVISPRFGPATWRDFQLADLFLEAGRQAARKQLDALRALARPQSISREPRAEFRPPSVSIQESPEHRQRTGLPFTLNDIQEILHKLIGLSESRLPDDLNITFEEMGLDSIDFLELQIEMEQRYGLHVTEQDAQTIRTVGEAIDYVNCRLHQSQ